MNHLEFPNQFARITRRSPAKSRDIPPKTFDFPGFEGHTELLGPHPFACGRPLPHWKRYPDSKVWVCALFRARALLKGSEQPRFFLNHGGMGCLLCCSGKGPAEVKKDQPR